MKIKEVIVVEGKNDTNKIKQAVNADTIETNGAALSKKTITLINHAQKKRGVIVFTDPDFAGERIRDIISKEVPNCKHAFLSRKDAKAKRANASVGIEHATNEAIREALKNVQQIKQTEISDITQQDLIKYGLVGTQNAKMLREQLGMELHIGYTNAKQLLHRLQMFAISKDELNEAMMSILERGNVDG